MRLKREPLVRGPKANDNEAHPLASSRGLHTTLSHAGNRHGVLYCMHPASRGCAHATETITNVLFADLFDEDDDVDSFLALDEEVLFGSPLWEGRENDSFHTHNAPPQSNVANLTADALR
ncbi:hypothetical protein H257_07316 [Aphanomyces astaci]|uniref:Uncharacterized protein n=1 Tax=Aphanomyces astaci TaxID=112090 RepID=W4GHW0_APHAT|nr:hypothetical protein H257_07316 [Aphanomyces astaci]ETV79252.1 hypothetical protein H257_07316 [Aphanomyces astaci]|eukprot:XP_009831093.1 hypothetical protein H257_07316 [Aphanomyces astaci]